MTPERWQQIETLYHAARARPSAERAAFLADACRTDDTLRREIEHLLSQPASDEGFLARPAAAISAGLTAEPGRMTGRTLGGYHVEALIGVGGMGEVYRARDGKLGRAVAIKVLPHAFTSDPTRLARLDREARMLAALNHPNICAIHGFEEAQEIRFLILEFVDGETLADRLAASRQRPDGPGLPQREALMIARQIARALDFAHEAGIVHRDLKPANIKITAGNDVKVLDFGLAKATVGDAAGADLATVPGVMTDGTMDGAILGTPGYMSPEQARGKPVDKRTDIWAFGCVLYEMLTGRATFRGDTPADTLARVIEHEPDWTALPVTTPQPIRNLLLGCLAKDPRERLRDIGDVRITIDSILSGSSGAVTVVPVVRPARRRAAWLPWAMVAALVVVVAGMAAWNFRPQPPQPAPRVVRFSYKLPDGQSFDRSGGAHVVAVSRDGERVAYVASPDLLYIGMVDDMNAKALPGTEVFKGMREPAFSPRGSEIAFYAFADHTLKWMPVSGGAALTICPADTPTGIDWAVDGVFFGQGSKGIMRVSPNGGTVQRVASVEDGQEAHGPQVLPDGKHVLFTIATGTARDRWDSAQIVVQSLTSDARTILPISGSDARYVPATGHLIYAVAGRVWAVGFDLERHAPLGTSVQVEEGVSRAAGDFTGTANFSVSDTGVFIYVPGPVRPQTPMDVALLDPITRKTTKLNLPSDWYVLPRVSPDESRIAFGNERDKEWTVYTFAISGRSSLQPLTAGSNNRYPTWASSTRLAFQSDRGGDLGIWWQAADGADDATRLTTAAVGEAHAPESWSADTLLYSVTKNDRVSLWTLPVRNGTPGTPRPFGRSVSTNPMSGVFSPDGRVVAYTVTERGTTTICVEPFPATRPRHCLPPNLADSPKHPRWSHDGQRLFYDPRPAHFETVTVTTQPELHFGTREPLDYHPFRLGPPNVRTPYDVTRTGKFLGLITPGTDGYTFEIPNTIHVVLNWFEHLKEKMNR